MRNILKTRTQDGVSNLLIDNGIGEKAPNCIVFLTDMYLI